MRIFLCLFLEIFVRFDFMLLFLFVRNLFFFMELWVRKSGGIGKGKGLKLIFSIFLILIWLESKSLIRILLWGMRVIKIFFF